MDLYQLYRRSPVLLQNVVATGYGLKERLLRYGGQYQQYLREIRERERWPRERLMADQAERLRVMVRFAYQEVPYYRALFDRLGAKPDDIRGVADLRHLPVLEKETVRERPEDFVPRHLDAKKVAQTTGGTTGKPLRYWATPAALQYNYAMYEVRFRNWAGVRFGERMATINGKPIVPVEQQAPPFWRVNLAFNQLYLSPYHLGEANLGHYVKRMQAFRPVVIVGYVSTVHAVARYMLANGLRGAVKPRAVLTSSETLFPWIRAEIEDAFQCRAWNGYSLGELTCFISQCEAGQLHESPDYGVIEMVEADGREEIIATGLFNQAFPLIRYRTGDVARSAPASATCACGRELPVVEELIGRIDDRVITPEGVVVGPAALSLAFQAVPNLKDAQIYQEDAARVKISITVAPAWSDRDRAFLEQELRRRLGLTLAIELVVVDAIPRTVAGKQRLIVSKIKSQSASSWTYAGAQPIGA